MSASGTSVEHPPEATLRPDAVGFGDALVIGLASTLPAYSLAAVLGPIVALVGVGPLVGAGLLVWLGVGVMAAGVLLMLWWRHRDATFWRERPGVSPN